MSSNSTSDTDGLPTRHLSPAGVIRCPRCDRPNHHSAMICAFCGEILDRGGQTRILSVPGTPPSPELPSTPLTTNEILPAEDTVTFQMGDRYLTLKLQESIIFGRSTNDPQEPKPDVDLTPLHAQEMGISRRHLRIRYKEGHLYAVDMGSSNGTWLNGHRMMSYTEYPVRSSDELRLGLFKIKVRF